VRGGGRMRLDSEGTAAGLDDSAVATLRGADALEGDLLLLGDGAELLGLRIVLAPPLEGRTKFGNVVVVGSRGPDTSATKIPQRDAQQQSYDGDAREAPLADLHDVRGAGGQRQP
jgi:hypothetical protein